MGTFCHVWQIFQGKGGFPAPFGPAMIQQVGIMQSLCCVVDYSFILTGTFSLLPLLGRGQRVMACATVICCSNSLFLETNSFSSAIEGIRTLTGINISRLISFWAGWCKHLHEKASTAHSYKRHSVHLGRMNIPGLTQKPNHTKPQAPRPQNAKIDD